MKEEKENLDKHNLVLIIIAIATMLVVLVGASFAYFSYNITKDKAVKTSFKTNANYTGDLIFNVDSNLSLAVDVNNLKIADIGSSASDYIIAEVSYYVNGPELYRKYDMRLNINSNNFVYSSGECRNSFGNLEAADNRVDCEAEGHTWTTNDIPELGLFVYKGDQNINQTSCNNISKCIDKTNLNISDNTSCSGYIKKAIYENGVCFIPELSRNITGNTTSENLYNQVKITSSNSSYTKHYYLVEVAMLNLVHDQKENYHKTFSGTLNFTSASGS